MIAPVAGFDPLIPCGFKELEIARIMNGTDGFGVESFRRADVAEAALLALAQDEFHRRRPLKRRNKLAAEQFAVREMQPVGIAVL